MHTDPRGREIRILEDIFYDIKENNINIVSGCKLGHLGVMSSYCICGISAAVRVIQIVPITYNSDL